MIGHDGSTAQEKSNMIRVLKRTVCVSSRTHSVYRAGVLKCNNVFVSGRSPTTEVWCVSGWSTAQEYWNRRMCAWAEWSPLWSFVIRIIICLWVIQLEMFFYIDEYVVCFWCGTPIKGPLSVRFSGVIWFRRGCVANIQTDLVIVISSCSSFMRITLYIMFIIWK